MYFNEDGTAEFLQELISHGEGVDLDGGKNETIQVATVAFKEFDTTVNGWLVKEQFKSLKNYVKLGKWLKKWVFEKKGFFKKKNRRIFRKKSVLKRWFRE